MQRIQKNSLFSIFAWLIIIMGMSLLFIGANEFNNAQHSTHWLETTGKIIQSDISQKLTSRDQTEHIIYSPHIRYEYTIEGRIYQADRVNFLPQATTQSAAEAVNKQYPIGKIVTVYFNPDDIKIAVLETGATIQNYEPLIIGGVLLLLGIVLLRRQPKPKTV
ncbi:DUF3592 domain-containing protein [Beggiatoa leptomitoformis]|uniref:DUF3592 domain-containing protein n=1 Tax=Beggiatoa leptomitoformis TaxID=288004 RepID=A0A2N9YI82_9GAMM|nr:DUF3592 domain-containing protein [Beggiatoa leptomitoformis]ALG67561.1 DUF3592 domain-containing protein [Beggiatoa leptomitoformis]AUI70210.1 DUF3592 domain-containing protein [Beggiatoa leptomitoformis]